MCQDRGTVLVGEDEWEVRVYLETALKCLGYSVELARDGAEVISCLETLGPKVIAVVLDVLMPNLNGLDTLAAIRRTNPLLPVIMLSGASTTTNVVAAMKSGATDFLCKPILHEELHGAVLRALQTAAPQKSPQSRVAATPTATFLGNDPKMKDLAALIDQVGWSEAPVLIQGETGSGKEVLARELHARSPRAKKPLLKLNCAALPSELVESELFGYERGAFTGAFQKKAGMFEQAHGGTILLDEIGDMDVRLQAKLLQVLQDQEFQRVGGKETIRVDVRVMAATHRDLEAAIAVRSFREDLYYRLNVINLVVPPLRERREDILPLVEVLIDRHGSTGEPRLGVGANLRQAMLMYSWPGNVRELENFVRKLLILRDAEMLARELWSKTARSAPMLAVVGQRAVPAADRSGDRVLEEVRRAKDQAESEVILAALGSTRWNRKEAARRLNIEYKALLYKMKKLGIDAEGSQSTVEPVDEYPRALAATGS